MAHHLRDAGSRQPASTANASDQELTPGTEQVLGVSATPKAVRYAFPADMEGVVLFSHGTGGSSNFIESTEALPLALALFARGLRRRLHRGGGDPSPATRPATGKQRWNTRPTADNVDLGNLEILFDDLEARGLIPTGTPKYALGMSAGGVFSHFLGTVGDLAVVDQVPAAAASTPS